MDIQLIEQKIHEVRGQRVMLDFDLAELYEVETRRLNEQVKRNAERFPEDFMFQLSANDWQNINTMKVQAVGEYGTMMSQIATSSQGKRKKSALPFAFTEHGVTMLASVLRSPRAVKMNIAIVRAFIALRQNAHHYKQIAEQLDAIRGRLGEHDAQFNHLYDAFENLMDKKTDQEFDSLKWDNRERIGFKK